MKFNYAEWPLFFVSKNGLENTIINHLKDKFNFNTLVSSSLCDAQITFDRNKSISALFVDYFSEDHEQTVNYLKYVKRKNSKLPIILISEQAHMNDIESDIYAYIDDCVWRGESSVDNTFERIENLIDTYLDGLYPPFFKALVEYTYKNKYAWHTPGHMGGEGFKKSGIGQAFVNYFGENLFKSDLSISVPELGSLLDHSGVVNESERYAAKTFGSSFTYYVLNGTSSVNQIIWHARVAKDDTALVDRNCHKSLNYAMVDTDANPVYLIPRRNPRGIIGPVSLSEFSPEAIKNKVENADYVDSSKPVQMSALTNSTYDGLCYNVKTIKSVLKNSVNNLHFDEAWYAYARFHPIYKDHYAMTKHDDTEHPPIFAGHSTHKLLTAFSQSSMIHIKDGSNEKVNEVAFNEAYMLHGSTSPQYNMMASLDVATHMMAREGEEIYGDVILGAIRLRKKIASICDIAEKQNDWFFNVWQPVTVTIDGNTDKFTDVADEVLAYDQSVWTMTQDNNWHGFDDIEDNYVMLDPTKVTFTTPGLNEDGTYQEEGIPASMVTDYLILHGIVCEKTDYYSFLMLNSIGTNESKQANLIAALMKFKQNYDLNTPLSEVFPSLVEGKPNAYQQLGLKEHCQNIHKFRIKNDVMKRLQSAFSILPDVKVKPAEAYRQLVRGLAKPVFLDEIIGHAPAVMVVPYPPGIPVIMGGEVLNKKDRAIVDYLTSIEDFENQFPGYENDIHGVEREIVDGKIKFKILCLTDDK